MCLLVPATAVFQFLGCSGHAVHRERTVSHPVNNHRRYSPSLEGPVIWLPRDRLGLAEQEISQARLYSTSLNMSCEGASLGTGGEIVLHSHPFGWK